MGADIKCSSDGPVRVALDVEGVLADIHTPFLEEYNDRFGTQFTLEDITEWEFGDVRDHFVDETGYEDVDAFLQGVDGVFDGFLPMSARYWKDYGNPDAPDRIPPVEQDIGQAVRELGAALDDTYREHRMDIVTSRTGVDDHLQAWLADHGIRQGPEYRGFVVAHDKHNLPYHTYIDDNPNLMEYLDTDRYDRLPFLYDRPYNRDVDTDTHIRTFNLRDVATYIAADTIE